MLRLYIQKNEFTWRVIRLKIWDWECLFCGKSFRNWLRRREACVFDYGESVGVFGCVFLQRKKIRVIHGNIVREI